MAGDAGPLVICVPGMGDVRQTYRLLAPRLLEQGYRVATMDLRGHGDSDATFSSYDDVALATDILALIEELGTPAIVVGNSMGAGAAVWAAAEKPAKITGLALLGPFVRDPEGGRLTTLLFRLAMLKPWGPATFLSYYPRWLPGTKPDGYDEHTILVRENLRRPGHWRAFSQTTRTSHAPAAARIGERLHAEVVMVPGVGHYPQAQAPAVTAAAVTRLVEGAARG